MSDRSYLTKSSVLVTGGCGFIGSNFIRYLFSQPEFTGTVTNIDSLTYAGNPLSLASVEEAHSDRYTFQRLDICDKDGLSDLFSSSQFDAVIHFAAESHVDRSIVAPDAFVSTNVTGTHNLLMLCREHFDFKTSIFHHVSTDEVYGSLGDEGYFTEETAYDPSSPYSSSKAASDHLVRAYHRTYGLPVTISNCSNNYGPYHFPEKLIPLMILRALRGESLPVYGDGQNVRDWLFVEDHCSAIWAIVCGGRLGETYLVGGNSERNNLEVVEQLCLLIDSCESPLKADLEGKKRNSLIEFVKDRPGHDWRYAIDASKLRKELSWEPTVSFEEGLSRTIDWYLANNEWVSQIESGAYLEWVSSHYS